MKYVTSASMWKDQEGPRRGVVPSYSVSGGYTTSLSPEEIGANKEVVDRTSVKRRDCGPKRIVCSR